jgi:23S rRNA pseudouridine955/2504/2580 synthase
MKSLSKGSASWLEVDESADGQRIDNFLVKALKGVPRSHVYRILRSGEVRVNSGRIRASYRLQAGDRVRLPPVRVAEKGEAHRVNGRPVGESPLFEDDWLLAINKPAGMAVHGGSGVSMGVIERLRDERPQQPFLELAHRLDRETSGVLLLAKRRSALTNVHAQLREGRVDKRYRVLVQGHWKSKQQTVRLPLRKYVSASGERRVLVDQDEGAVAITVFKLMAHYEQFSLLEAHLKTGRTHQIRVHLAHLGFPIAGDDKYGDFAANKVMEKQGLKRMFLHAVSMRLIHPGSGETLQIHAPLARELEHFLESRNPETT